MQEEWRPVPGYETRYEVSNMGGVRSLRRGGAATMLEKPRPLRQQESRNAYQKGIGQKGAMTVRLFNGERQRCKQVHRLVLEAFVGPCPEGHECRHLNGDRHDNRVFNLAWGTRLQNAADDKRNGVSRAGPRNGRAKLSADQVREIRELRGEVTQQSLADRFGVTQTTISAIQRGERWGEVA